MILGFLFFTYIQTNKCMHGIEIICLCYDTKLHLFTKLQLGRMWSTLSYQSF